MIAPVAALEPNPIGAAADPILPPMLPVVLAIPLEEEPIDIVACACASGFNVAVAVEPPMPIADG